MSKEPNQETISTLKDLLVKAEMGELKSIICIGRYRGENADTAWAGWDSNEIVIQPVTNEINKVNQWIYDLVSSKNLSKNLFCKGIEGE